MVKEIKMQQYKVIQSKTNDGWINESVMKKFQEDVEEAMRFGWRLKGGVAVSSNNANSLTLYQAMVK
jgi:hypothetical protein